MEAIEFRIGVWCSGDAELFEGKVMRFQGEKLAELVEEFPLSSITSTDTLYECSKGFRVTEAKEIRSLENNEVVGWRRFAGSEDSHFLLTEEQVHEQFGTLFAKAGKVLVVDLDDCT